MKIMYEYIGLFCLRQQRCGLGHKEKFFWHTFSISYKAIFKKNNNVINVLITFVCLMYGHEFCRLALHELTEQIPNTTLKRQLSISFWILFLCERISTINVMNIWIGHLIAYITNTLKNNNTGIHSAHTNYIRITIIHWLRCITEVYWG